MNQYWNDTHRGKTIQHMASQKIVNLTEESNSNFDPHAITS